VTLNTLHEDLKDGFADLKGEMRGGFSDLKAAIGDVKTTLITGFRSMPTREDSQEMIRLLREGNRIQEERFAQLDLRIREQHFEIQQVLRALADGQRALLDGQRALLDGQRALSEEIRGLAAEIRHLSADIKTLIARLDALIKGRGDGSPTG
jgi:predicted  nucleic acid-binding Zn-ribbon protein